MKIEDFSDKAGKLIKIRGDAYAFVPRNLPVDISYDDTLVNLLTKAMLALGEVDGIGKYLPNPEILIRPYLIKEAVTSSRIEGTKITMSEFLLYDAGRDEKAADIANIMDVKNNIAALNHGLNSQGSDVNLTLIKEMHRILMSGNVRGHDNRPGEFRNLQNYIGSQMANKIEKASFVPPPYEYVSSLMEQLEIYMNSDNKIPFLIRLALIHYQFETIHPFEDGNGRIGRLITTLLLCKKNIISKPLIYTSAFFEKRRNEYEGLLLRINQKGEYEEWIKFFLKAIGEQAEDAIQRASKLLKIRETFIERVKDKRTNKSTMIIESLLKNPYITISKVARETNITYPTAKRIIEEVLIPSGILQKFSKPDEEKLYCAAEILDILTSNEND